MSCCRTGSGGSLSTFSGLCVLPLNMVNQKFYTIFFLWLIILSVLSGVMLVIRFALIFSPDCREFMMTNIYNVRHVKVASLSIHSTRK